ncbi:helix-turn-helix domain-containing protein [Streptomyces sp. NPDC016562]|uniref:AraC family transcriptional regulator n=1 Tax=Streptomyces sp. NPDC016562 TaxID=3364966 RepID=UPI0036F92700
MRVWSCPSGTWEYAWTLPHPRLRPGVCGYRGFRLDPAGVRRRLELPDGMVTLVAGFGGPATVTDLHGDPPGPAASHVSLASGLHTHAVLVEHDGPVSGLQIMLAPWTAFTLLGTGLHGLANTVVALEDVLGVRGRTLPAVLASVPGWAGRFGLLDSVLIRALEKGPPAAPQVARAWQLLSAGPRPPDLGVLAAQVGWSERQLRRRFEEQIGLSPKPAARVARLRSALRMLTGGQSAAATASACGFHDQAHFHHEFKAMTSLTPADFLVRRRWGAAGPQPLDRIPGEPTGVALTA